MRCIIIRTQMNILEQIASYQDKLTPKQKKLAAYITANYQKAAFLNSTDLAKAAEVSGSSVIRFAEILNYSGFPAMQAALHNMVQMELNTRDMFADPYEKAEPDSLNAIFKSGAEHIRQASRSISVDKFNQAIALINCHEKILIVGHQISSICADYMHYSLGRVRPNVYKLTAHTAASYNVINSMTEKDIAIVYAFPRFPQLTHQCIKSLHEQHVPIIYITETGENPLAKYATLTIAMRTRFASYIDDLGPALNMARAICVTLSNLNREQTNTQLEKFENYVKCSHIFCNHQEDILSNNK